MYWAVLVVDLTGMQLPSPAASRSLLLAGSLLTVPLAQGLYFALRPVQNALAVSALGFRLTEVILGLVSNVAGFASMKRALSQSAFGTALLDAGRWGDATAFGAFVFTIGSTIFFYLFVKSRYIPRVLAWWGLFASVVAMAACITHLLRPAFPALTMYAWVPMLLAETSTGLWLLIKSVKVET
jgi:hypothetical protein